MDNKRLNPSESSYIDNIGNNLRLLTGREKQVLRLLVQGFPYKKVAYELMISKKTVEFHASKIYKKLQVNDRFELADTYTHHVLKITRDS